MSQTKPSIVFAHGLRASWQMPWSAGFLTR